MERTNGFHSGYRAKSMSTLQTRSADTGISIDVAIACRIYGRSTQPSDLHSWHRIFPVPCLILPVPSHRVQSMLALDRTGSSTTSSGYLSAPATRNIVRNGSDAGEAEPSSTPSRMSPCSVSSAQANHPSASGSALYLRAACANASPPSPFETRSMSARIITVMESCTGASDISLTSNPVEYQVAALRSNDAAQCRQTNITADITVGPTKK